MKTDLSILKPRHQDYLECLFGLNGNKKMTMQEVADLHDLSKERIRQIYNQSINLLKANDPNFTIKDLEE
jgi:RNA polymerase primary sigma factor